MKNLGSIILNVFIVDPWTTWVWTMQVHIYADFFQEIYSRLSVSTASTSMEKKANYGTLHPWVPEVDSGTNPPRYYQGMTVFIWSNSLWLTSLLLPLPPPPWSCDCLSYPLGLTTKSLGTWTLVLTLLAFWLLTWGNPFTLWPSSCWLTFRSCSGPVLVLRVPAVCVL